MTDRENLEPDAPTPEAEAPRRDTPELDTPEPDSPAPETKKREGKGRRPKLSTEEKALRRRAFLRGEHSVAPAAVVLVCIIYALLLLSRLIDTAFLNRENRYLSTILLQLMIFPIPAYLFIRYRGVDYTKAIRFRRFRLSHIFLILSATLFLISGCTLLGMLCGMMNAQPSFTLYDTFVSVNDGSVGSTIRLVLAYAVLPAFCEELVFRGILCAEYERHGILYAAAMSALFFAFLHFDLTALPVYLFAGMLLAIVMYVTRSTVAAMVVHGGYNLFGVFAQAGLSGYCRNTGSLGLLIVLLIVLLLLSAAFLCGEIARVLRRRAKVTMTDSPDEISTPGLNRLGARAWLPALRDAFASPAGIGALVLWVVGVAAHLLR